jgi:quinoprotein dehydrogenase-associated probable ABC transporter substrate-binding protein
MSSRCPDGFGVSGSGFRSRWPVLSRSGELLVLAMPAFALGIAALAQRHEATRVLAVATAEAATRDAARLTSGGTPTPESEPRLLRVCSDPNNLPFSNAKGEGFENRLAQLIAGELHATVAYTWHAQRRGFVRETLRANQCDLIMGVPSSFELVLPTRPYYRSTYVFVQRATRGRGVARVRSFDDPALRRLRVGVQFIGDDYANTPPAHALAARGIIDNVVGFSIYGDYAQPNPPARILDAVVDDSIDVAVVWGPLAGWYARHSRVALTIVPVSPQVDVPFLPFVFDVSMGVRRDAPALKAQVEEVLVRRRDAVERILDEYGVPRVGVARRRPARTEGGT